MPPSAPEVRALFRQYLRLGRQFPNYNIREYLKRKAKEDVRTYSAASDPAAADTAWERAKRELDVFKRQSLVYQLYHRKMRNVLEIDEAAKKAAKLRPVHAEEQRACINSTA